ncbi:MAG: Hsp20/alpha crystallin family protein [Pseudomonadota bacterium]
MDDDKNGRRGGAEGPTGPEAIEEIARRLGGLFDGLKDTVEAVGQKLSEAAREAGTRDAEAGGTSRKGGLDEIVDMVRNIRLDGADGPVEARIGWRVRGLDEALGDHGEDEDARPRPRSAPPRRRAASSRPSAESERPKRPTASMKKAPGKAANEEPLGEPAPRAAHIEAFDEADLVIVTAELPGVAADDISIELDGRALRLTASGAKGRRFEAEAELPADVALDDTAKPDMRLSNGVLEIRLPKGPQNDRDGSPT